MTRLFYLFTLVLLLAVASAPLVAQDTATNLIFAGEENPTGGDYCFGGDEAKSVNALWHVVGPQWRTALEAPENEYLRQPIRGKAREFVKNGVLYYTIMHGECLFVPAGMKARVDLINTWQVNEPAQHNNKGGTIIPPSMIPVATKWWQDGPTVLFLLSCLFVLIAIIMVDRKHLSEKARQKKLEDEKRDWEFNNPSQSGPPVITGGFGAIPQSLRYQAVVSELSETAAASFPGSIPREWKVVGDVVRGHLVDCDGTVRYGAGAKPQKRHFTNELCFRAMMEHIPTGERSVKFVLWACMNGAWTNMVEGTLNFVPDTNESGNVITLSPIIKVTASDIAQYGEPEFNLRYDGIRVSRSGELLLVRRAK